MNWHHRATPVRMLHEMVANFRPKDSKAGALQRSDDLASTESRQS
jgi:hypothetical protein